MTSRRSSSSLCSCASSRPRSAPCCRRSGSPGWTGSSSATSWQCPVAVEAAGDVNTLLLDKTGTITHGNRRRRSSFLAGVDVVQLARAAHLSSLADETPEGRSIVTLAEASYGQTTVQLFDATLVPFTAQTRMSGVDHDGQSIRKGATDAVKRCGRVGRDRARGP